MAWPWVSSMSFAQREWLSTGSTLSPMILQLRFWNSGISPTIYPSSVVQTGVKSFGWENRIAHPSPIQSWKVTLPWVVSAVKSGTSELILNDMMPLLLTDAPCESWSGTWPTADIPNRTRRTVLPFRLCLCEMSHISFERCVLRERQRYRRAVPAIHLRRWQREDGLPSIERSQSAHLAHSRAPRRRSPFRSHSRRSASADPAGQFRPADCLRHPGLRT